MGELNIISYGGGVNSTALIILLLREGVRIDEIIFSDPGNEMPETYAFIKVFKKWCAERNLTFTMVKSHEFPIRKYYYDRNIIPYRMFRSCTDRFKIRPIYKYLKEKAKEAHLNVYMGIDAGEAKRAKESGRDDRTMIYPLIDREIDREGCKAIIAEEGLEVPVKSGCYFCPFQKKSAWVALLREHPELFEDSIILEENCKAFPEGRFWNKPLRVLKEEIITQKTLEDYGPIEYERDKCVFCHD